MSSHRRLFARLFIGLGFASTVVVALLPASVRAENGDEISLTLEGKSCTVAGTWANAPTGPVTTTVGTIQFAWEVRCFFNSTSSGMDTKMSALWSQSLTGTITTMIVRQVGGGNHSCQSTSTYSIVDRGQRRSSTGAISGTATRSGLPLNYIAVAFGCKSATATTVGSGSSQFYWLVSDAWWSTNFENAVPCRETGGQNTQPCQFDSPSYYPIVKYKTSDPVWSTPTTEPDAFGTGGGFVHTECENAPVPYAVGGESMPLVVEPGDSVKYRVESDEEGEPPMPDGVRLWVRWADGYGAFQWKEFKDVINPAGDVAIAAEATLVRSTFATPTTSELVYYRCLDENADEPEYQYSTGDGSWGWEDDLPDIEPCSGVVLTDYGEGAYFAGSELTITVNVTLAGVEKIQADIGGADVFETLTGDPGATAGTYDPIPTGTYVLELIPYGSEPVARVDGDWRDLQVRCWDGVRQDGNLISGTEDGNFQGAEGNLFQRPEGEPPISQCRDQDWGDNPLDWAPAAGRMVVCFAIRLFVPGEFHDEVFDERWNSTTLIGWLMPAVIVSDAYDDLTSATGNCEVSYTLPMPNALLADVVLDLDFCSGTVGDMRTVSRTMSTLAIGLWAANRTAAKVMRILTGQYENWIEPHDTYDADMGMNWREYGAARGGGRYYS